MTAPALSCKPASDSLYRALLTGLFAAYAAMKETSEEFSRTVVELSKEPPEPEGRLRIDHASRTYDQAREAFLLSVARLNEFKIGELTSSRSSRQAIPAFTAPASAADCSRLAG